MKTSVLIRLAARDYLTKYNQDYYLCEQEPGKAGCLCFALDNAAMDQDGAGRASERAKTYISAALGSDRWTLEKWLVREKCITGRDRNTCTEELSLQIQNHRRAWAEQMAQYFESLGD